MAIAGCTDYIDAVQQAGTVDEVHSVCSSLCEAYGFERFIYGACIPTSFIKPYFIFISGYPKAWRDHYSEQNYMVIDPTVAHCASHITPLLWDISSLSHGRSPEVKRFMSEAQDFGLNSGVSFPVHSSVGDYAMLCLTSELQQMPKSLTDHVLPIGQLFTAYLHEAVRRIFDSEILPLSRVDLTEREKECLLWVTEGKTNWETSRILNISERTVVFHLQNVQEKLGVNNRHQAVARAVAMGVIHPQFNQ